MTVSRLLPGPVRPETCSQASPRKTKAYVQNTVKSQDQSNSDPDHLSETFKYTRWNKPSNLHRSGRDKVGEIVPIGVEPRLFGLAETTVQTAKS